MELSANTAASRNIWTRTTFIMFSALVLVLVSQYTYKVVGQPVGLFSLYPDSMRLRRYSGLKISVNIAV